MQEAKNNPLISVIIEGYNASLELGTIEEIYTALQEQDFPIEQVEVILVGSVAQAESWEAKFADQKTFSSVKTIGDDQAHYYQLKNKGAKIAEAEILGFLDSDVIPDKHWLSTIYDGIAGHGADVVAGISLFRDESQKLKVGSPFLLTAASISWGFVVPKELDGQVLSPNAFLSHNLGIRKSVFNQHFYREDLGRTCAGSLLFNSLLESGAKMRLQTKQQVAHNFSFWWWVSRLHLRFGYEVFRLRRIDSRYPNKFIARLSLLEPLISLGWYVMLDVPRWLRFSKALQISNGRRILFLPLVCGLSFLARGAEAIGMYLTLISPEKMQRRAARS
jgi:glycosyltransferase involved in cell wall biosynthesis